MESSWFRTFFRPHSARLQPNAAIDRVAGEKVVSSSNSSIYKYIKKNAGDALAVEMEGIGFLKACYAHESKQYILIRGISDLVDNKSETDQKGGQNLASLTAAAFAFEILNRIEER